MKKSIFGVCKKCLHIKKYENIEFEKLPIWNMQIIVCENCILADISYKPDIEKIQVNLFA